MKTADLKIGVRVGSLTLVSKTVCTLSSGRRMPAWSMKCDCGKVIVAMVANIVKGSHQSCGCQKSALLSSHYRGDTHKPEYSVYRQMLDRCYLPTAPNFQWYGGKGVTVTKRWRRGEDGKTGFQCFEEDMLPRPVGLTLDRINPMGDYSKENCRWATWEEQRHNLREHHMSPSQRARLRKQRSERIRGEKSPLAKLTDAQVALIKRRALDGARTGDLAKEFCVSPQTISGVKAGRSYTHVKPLPFGEAAE